MKNIGTNVCLEEVDQVNSSSSEDYKWSEEGPPKHWASTNKIKSIASPTKEYNKLQLKGEIYKNFASPKIMKGLKVVAVFPSPLLMNFGHSQTAEVIQNAELVVKNVALLIQARIKKKSTFSEVVNKKNKTLVLATGVGIAGVATAALGVSLLSGGPLLCGWGVAVAAAGEASTAAAAAGGTAAIAAGSAAVAAAGIVVANTMCSKDGSKRMIIIGNKGSNCKIGLVRPNVIIDKAWEDIVSKVKESAPQQEIIGPKFLSKGIRRRRHRIRDTDITSVENCELKVEDKIFLLISRSLNDKKSTVSFVYKQLILRIRDRAAKRKTSPDTLKAGDRSTRQDVHAVIRYITAILLEDKPEFCSSPDITELSAASVESLVLSEVYGIVFDEIAQQTQNEDQILNNKISDYKSASTSQSMTHQDINQTAIDTLRSMPSHHTVSGKLYCFVKVLESISAHAAMTNMGADWLLESVCHHIVSANVPNFNAECMFVEEFARDTELLRGVEGYALVTILAGLNYLNATSKITI